MRLFERIELIMTPHGARAIRLAVHRALVWTVFSEENRATVDALTASNLRDKISLSILRDGAPLPHDLETMVELAIEHHGMVPEIGLVGPVDLGNADAIMLEYGYARPPGEASLEYRLIARGGASLVDGAKL